MGINADLLRAFAAVATYQSFTQAADALAISQPAISATIRRLESQLGYPLLNRTSRRVSPTPEGLALLPHAVALADAYGRSLEVISATRARHAQLVRMGCPNYVYWPQRTRLTNLFTDRFPMTQLDVFDGTLPQLLEKLDNAEIDVLLCNFLAGMRTRGFRSLVLGKRVVHLLLRIDHPLTAHTEINPEDLAGETILLAAGRAVPTVVEALAKYFEGFGAIIKHAPDSTRNTIEHLAHSRNFISLRWLDQDVDQPLSPKMGSRPIAGNPLQMELRLLYPKSGLSRAAADFIDTAKQVRHD
jgi:DNA-binding transcriptional LysR family regulator